MEVFAPAPFPIMGAATLFGPSLLLCLVALEPDPERWRPAAAAGKPYRRRMGLIGRHTPPARRGTAPGRAPRAMLPTSHKGQALKARPGPDPSLGLSLSLSNALSLPQHRQQARRKPMPSARSQASNEDRHQ